MYSFGDALPDWLTSEAISDICAMDLFLIQNRSEADATTESRRLLAEVLYLRPDYDPVLAGNGALVLQSLDRHDYSRFFSEVIATVSCLESDICIPRRCVQHSGSLKPAFKLLKDCLRLVVERGPANLTTTQKRFIACGLARYLIQAAPLLQLEPKAVIVHASMQPLEALVCHYFNARGVPTATLQHGLYVDYAARKSVNAVNYLVQPAQHVLVWGSNTENLLRRGSRRPQVNYYVCGKIRPAPGIAPRKPTEVKELQIIFDHEDFKAYNFKLLTLIADAQLFKKYKISARYHPRNDSKFYEKNFPWLTTRSGPNRPDIYIGISSSLVIEAVALGCVALQFESTLPMHTLDGARTFSTPTQLQELLQDDELLVETPNLARNFIEATGDEATRRYRRALNQIIQDGVVEKALDVSVIIPILNRQHHVLPCFESIRAQRNKNLQIIFVDGGSTDQTLTLLKCLAAQDSRVTVLSAFDSGIYDAMNRGLQAAGSQWVYFMGCDDRLFDPHALDIPAEYRACSSVGMLYGNVHVVGNVKWAASGSVYDGQFDKVKLSKKNICQQAIFYRRDKLIEVGGFDTAYPLCADYDVNLKIFGRYGAAYLDRVVSEFHAGGASTSGTDPAFGKVFKSSVARELGISL